MARVALELYRFAVFHGDEHTASVRTIMRAGGVNNSLGWRLHGRLDDYIPPRSQFFPLFEPAHHEQLRKEVVFHHQVVFAIGRDLKVVNTLKTDFVFRRKAFPRLLCPGDHVELESIYSRLPRCADKYCATVCQPLDRGVVYLKTRYRMRRASIQRRE